mmetsp:Transcript_9526/g.21638  ORF Transcript_9526/g.21638 Transcript_9526/m.21638 type:complete len:225 (-) Transcript_9526:211-885(-)
MHAMRSPPHELPPVRVRDVRGDALRPLRRRPAGGRMRRQPRALPRQGVQPRRQVGVARLRGARLRLRRGSRGAARRGGRARKGGHVGAPRPRLPFGLRLPDRGDGVVRHAGQGRRRRVLHGPDVVREPDGLPAEASPPEVRHVLPAEAPCGRWRRHEEYRRRDPGWVQSQDPRRAARLRPEHGRAGRHPIQGLCQKHLLPKGGRAERRALQGRTGPEEAQLRRS